MDIRAKDPRARDLVCICIQEGHSAWELKYIKNEAKNLYKKLKKSRDKHLFQTGQWDQMRIIDFAVLGGHNVLFDTLVKWLHVDPNIPDRDYNKLPLHHAAQEGHDSMVKTLLEKCNSPIDARDKCDSTPLSYAILHGQNSTVDLLLDHGASTQLSNFCGRPMHCAAFHGNIHAVKRMHGVNAAAAEAVVFGFCTPILAAISGGSFDCTKFLAEVTDITGIPLMYKAIACTNSESAALKIVETLLQNGVNANLLDEELFESLPIISAAKRGWESVVDALLIPTDQVPGIDWSVGGLIGHVNTEEFKEADEVQRETRLGHLKTRIVQDLDNMHHLSAEVICQSLRFDMGDNTWYSWTCLCQLIRKFAEAARPVPCSVHELISIGCYSVKQDDLDMALVVAKACLALQPDNENCITFHEHVLGLQEGTSSSGRS